MQVQRVLYFTASLQLLLEVKHINFYNSDFVTAGNSSINDREAISSVLLNSN